MNENAANDPERWTLSDFWVGLLFTATGVVGGLFLVQLLVRGEWLLLIITGWSWLVLPFLFLLGANAMWESLKAGARRLYR